MNINRRQLLKNTAGATLAGMGIAQSSKASMESGVSLEKYATEAKRLNARILSDFWDDKVGMFRAPVRSAETVDSDPAHNNGYVFWPSLMGLQALIAGEKQYPGAYKAQIDGVYDGLEKYYDAPKYAYNAWLNYPGNNDKYYDDNGWAVCILVEAYEATGNLRYRNRADEIQTNYLYGGWDGSEKPGGVRWGTDPAKDGTADKNTCSTASSALGALLLARVGVKRERNIAWAKEALNWLYLHLKDSDDLFFDGLHAPEWSIQKTKWTYNTGAPIQAYAEMFKLTKDKESLHRAKTLAIAATDRSKALYDSAPRKLDERYYSDSSFFVPYLIDGLLTLYRITKDKAILKEAMRNADYAYSYLRDPVDGLYFRNWRLWRIDETRYQQWRELTGQEFHLEADESERSKERKFESLPVSKRPMTKTLLANAGAARIFWQLARV